MQNVNFEYLLKKIKRAKKLNELHAYHQRVFDVLNAKPFTLGTVINAYNKVNKVHHMLMQRVLTLAEQEMKVNITSSIKRPKHLCFYLLGSGARSELTVWTDQDNGILYECSLDEVNHCKAYINEFAKITTNYLHQIGYPYCPGNVMATNERWSKSLSKWDDTMATHVHQLEPADIQFLYIAADLKPIYGDHHLAFTAQEKLYKLINSSRKASQRMKEHNIIPKVPIGILGQIHEQRWGEHTGEINIKTSLYVPIVNFIKYLAIRYEIMETSTLKRLEMLFNKGIITERSYIELKDAFITGLYYRLSSSTRKEEGNNYVNLHSLPKEEKRIIKSALKTAKSWQRQVLHWNEVNKNE